MAKSSMFPNYSQTEILRDAELNLWQIIDEHKGTIVKTLSELKKLIPKNEMYGEIFVNRSKNFLDKQAFGNPNFIHKGFIRYSRPLNNAPGYSIDVAYKCRKCEQIVVGAPKLETDDSLDGNNFLGGRRGLDYICNNCDVVMSTYTFEQS